MIESLGVTSRCLLNAILYIVTSFVLGACSGDDPMTIRMDFRQSDQGWVASFADYPVGQDAFYELEADYRALPEPLSGSGLFISGSNHSDDLWLY